MNATNRKKLVRQSTCPAVIPSKETIPFCIPSYKNQVENSNDDAANNGHYIPRYGSRRQIIPAIGDLSIGVIAVFSFCVSQTIAASSLGSLNKDLYIVDQYENQENGNCMDGNFSSASPANFPSDHVGRVYFRVTYEENSETLILSLLKARNLRRSSGTRDFLSLESDGYQESGEETHKRSPSVRLKRKLFAMSKRYTTSGKTNSQTERNKTPNDLSHSSQRKMNSLVNIYLLPDKRVFGQAKCKKVDVDPIFVDRFVFQVTASELKTRSLRMVFIEIDEDQRHHIIGHVTKPLSSLEFGSQLSYEDLEKGQPPNSKDSIDCIEAEILLSLSYDNDFSRLTVVLLRMKLFAPPEQTADLEQNIDLKFNIRGKWSKTKKCKTIRHEVAKSTAQPTGHTDFALNESFRFDLKQEEFDIANLTIKVKSKIKDKETASSVSLGGYMFARGDALEHWVKMTNSPHQFVQQWHSLASSSIDER